MSSPLFSIVIPTKNRSFVVGDAVRSALRQTFGDLEVVVVDNDDSDATALVVRTFADRRLRYVRSGGLTMPDNWDFAFKQAQGEYILLLEDKNVLLFDALEKLAPVIDARRPEVMSWRQDVFDDLKSPPVIYHPPRTGAVNEVDPVEALRLFIHQARWDADQILPRGINSAISRKLYQKIIKGPYARLCPPLSPDYTMAFQQLAFAEKLVHIDDSLSVYGSCRHSQGTKTLGHTNSLSALKKDFGADCDFYSQVPLKLLLVTTGLYNDYALIRERLGGRLKDLPLDMGNFFVECHHDLDRGEAMGASLGKERAAWKAALEAQPSSVQAEVEAKLHPKVSLIRRLWQRSGAEKIMRALKDGKDTAPPPVELPTFASAFAYAEFMASPKSIAYNLAEVEKRRAAGRGP